MKSSLPTVTVVLYKSKTLANGEHPIMLRLCYNGQRKYKSFGLSCSEKMWDEVDKANKRIMELYANYLVNVNLKRIAERLGMKPITFYSARHTYASALYNANVPMGLIAQNMGRNPAEIETYLKDFDRDSVIDANQHLYVTSTEAYKEGKEARLERRRAERINEKVDDTFAE